MALRHAIYLRNRSPIERLGFKTPIERVTKKKPDLSHLRIFGSIVYYHIPKQKRIQSEHFNPHEKKGILVGFDLVSSKTVKSWIPGTRQVIVERDVDIIESNDKYNGEDPTDETYEEDIGPLIWSLTDSLQKLLSNSPPEDSTATSGPPQETASEGENRQEHQEQSPTIVGQQGENSRRISRSIKSSNVGVTGPTRAFLPSTTGDSRQLG